MKKIIALLLTVILTATVAIGGTVAYLQDTDSQRNTFTTGNVKIDLWEDFGNNSGLEELLPAVGSAQDGTLKNGIEKEVYVTNTGSEDAYVRVHIAIPAVLDDVGNAGKNILHFNFDPANAAAGMWDWSKTAGEAYTGDWNVYTAVIDNVSYNVYVVTYESTLTPGEVTVDAISQVYMDSSVTNEDIQNLKETLGEEWYIYIAAEACQADGFADAYEALNTSFGIPGSYNVANWNESKEATFTESNLVEGVVSQTIYVSSATELVAAMETNTEGNEIVKVVLTQNIDLAECVDVTGRVILDMNGKTINHTGGKMCIWVRDNEDGTYGSLTITGNGTFHKIDHNANMIYFDGELNIMNGSFEYEPYRWGECEGCKHGTNALQVGSIFIGRGNKYHGVLNIYGGTFDAGVLNPEDFKSGNSEIKDKNASVIMYPTLNNNAGNPSSITVYGGTFVSANPANGDVNKPYSLYLEGQTTAGEVPSTYTVVVGSTEDGRITYSLNYHG